LQASDEEVVRVGSPSDARVHDHVALDEIELYGELIIAAAASDGPLSQVQIDAVLGIRRGCVDCEAEVA
jgi:hypothetical protein